MTTRDAAPALPSDVVDAWQQRIGVAEAEHPPSIRLSGQDGLRSYGQHVEVLTDKPESFDSVMYIRKLSVIGTFCSLHTPFQVVRTPRLIRQQPSEDLVIGVHTMRGRHTVKQGSRDFAYGPGQLAFVSNASPYSERTYEINDPAGLVIPLELLGDQRRIAEQAIRPVASHTLLARSTAAFILQFASDTAVAAADPDHDTEMAAIELVRAALGQLDFDNRRLTDNALFVREAVTQLIERHHRDPSFSPDTIARHLHISRRQLYRHFEDTEDSLACRIADRRLKSASALLRTRPEMSVTEVARASGFPSSPTMRNRFRAELGVGPSEYRARFRQSEGIGLTTRDRSLATPVRATREVGPVPTGHVDISPAAPGPPARAPQPDCP
ncbi:helix-turn-helix domain-containing protein [Gordonia jinghuaiqii]|uniref:Helix-turn-helix domain-containing protein n=1 Tax=Gordonia jinghuaiqii TaxID=2758710 RepID=A0A7D7LYM7_9ACTN|nr:helix-turn-helix domain-containing protein [Gordonia jinghuaiqii]MCR5980298.1 helix-turn-helix domain-containing protein [Gordonia jinghuaiqii]QMT01954.1 helix-turn-helix domain-containing protein [Gordonia jinghuaiqii]